MISLYLANCVKNVNKNYKFVSSIITLHTSNGAIPSQTLLPSIICKYTQHPTHANLNKQKLPFTLCSFDHDTHTNITKPGS
jgi:hypothetical protein